MQKSIFVDYARGFSILTIVIYHYLNNFDLPQPLQYAINFGGAGVHLFFFISGFGLAMSNYINYRAFLVRRLFKVLLPYYIAITLIFLINSILNVYSNGIIEFLSHIFLFKMFIPRYEVSFGPHFWFISTLIQFYMFFPIFIWVMRTKKYVGMLVISILISLCYSLIISTLGLAEERVYNSFFIQYLWEFMLGMIVAKMNLINKITNKPIYFYIYTALSCIIITAFLAIKCGVIGKSFNDIFSFSAYASVVVILFRLKIKFNQIIFWVATISYPLYLLHMFIWEIVQKFFSLNNFFVGSIALLLAVLISYFFNLCINIINKTNTFKPSIVHSA